MAALPILRSVGGGLHPVGPLTVSNHLLNPNFLDVSGGVITQWPALSCTLTPDPLTPSVAKTNTGKYTPTASPNYITQFVAVTPQDQWTLSAGVNIPVALTTDFDFFMNIYDSLGTYIYQFASTAILPGVTTSGWVRPSVTVTMPTTAAFAYVYLATGFYYVPTAFTPFYVNAIQFEKSATPSPYGDGNLSGRIWAGAPNLSQTIQTEFPDALRAFGTYPLAGGMGAAGSMNAPQYATLTD